METCSKSKIEPPAYLQCLVLMYYISKMGAKVYSIGDLSYMDQQILLTILHNMFSKSVFLLEYRVWYPLSTIKRPEWTLMVL